MYRPNNQKPLTTIQTSKTSSISPYPNQIHNNPPSDTISKTHKGEELSFQPISSYRYTISSFNQNFKSKNPVKHTRFPTTPGICKFVPATEIVFNEKIQNPEDENPTEEVSDDIMSNVYYGEQAKHSVVYPNMYSNKWDFLRAAADKPGNFLAGSPQDRRISSLYTLNSTNSYKKAQVQNDCSDKKSKNKRKVLICLLKRAKEDGLGRIYCEKCKENTRYSVRVRDIKGSL
jgi:hypothetical protein